MFLHVADAAYIEAYKVQVSFNDGRKGVADLSEAMKGPIFSPLKEKSSFYKLEVDTELGTIVWPNGADLAPEYIYFLAFKDDLSLQEKFKHWGYIV